MRSYRVIMDSSTDSSTDDEPDERCSSPEGVYVARQPIAWLSLLNDVPSPSELITFQCPYKLRKTGQVQFNKQLWTVGDIVSLNWDAKPNKTYYAQIVELFENNLCEKRARVMWLGPKSNVGVIDEVDKVHYDRFKPEDFKHISMDKRLVPIDCLKFIMTVPDHFEYKKRIGTDYLVDTQILSHAERYNETEEDYGPKPKSKVRRIFNKFSK